MQKSEKGGAAMVGSSKALLNRVLRWAIGWPIGRVEIILSGSWGPPRVEADRHLAFMHLRNLGGIALYESSDCWQRWA